MLFDALEILYQYEPRIFNLPPLTSLDDEGTRYTPDFLLTARSIWVEVKVHNDHLDRQIKLGKCQKLSEIIDNPIILITTKKKRLKSPTLLFVNGEYIETNSFLHIYNLLNPSCQLEKTYASF